MGPKESVLTDRNGSGANTSPGCLGRVLCVRCNEQETSQSPARPPPGTNTAAPPGPAHDDFPGLRICPNRAGWGRRHPQATPPPCLCSTQLCSPEGSEFPNSQHGQPGLILEGWACS